MTARLTITLALTALLTTSSCAADLEAPAGSAGLQTPAKPAETHAAGADAPMPHDHVPALEIIEKVNAFYDSAWNKLLIVITAVVLLVGGLVPFVLQRLQRASFARDRTDLETQIARDRMDLEEQITRDRTDLEDQIKSSAATAAQDITAAEKRMLARVEDAMKESKAALEELAKTTHRKLAEENFRQSWRFFTTTREHDPGTAFFVGLGAIRAGLEAGDLVSLDVFLAQYVEFINEADQKAILAASDVVIRTVEVVIADLAKHEIPEQTQHLVEELKKAVSEAKMSKPPEGTDSTG